MSKSVNNISKSFSSEKSRNGTVDLLKFIFAVAVLIYHGRVLSPKDTPLFFHGYFSVDFFFIVSGYYMTKAAITKGYDTGKFIFNKYKGFLPYHTFCFILAFISMCVINNYSNASDVLKYMFCAVPEYLIFPNIAGLKFSLTNVNSIEWYLSAMLLAMTIVYPLVKRFPKAFCTVIGPMLFLFISGYLFNENGGTYNCTNNWNGYICLGLLRAIAEISVGGTLYYLTTKEPSNNTDSKSPLFYTFGEILCYAVVLIFMNSTLENKYEFSAIYFLIAALYFTFSQKSLTAGRFNNAFIYFLGKLSLPMYLNQGWIRRVLVKWNPHWGYYKSELLFVSLTFAVSLVCILLVDSIMKLVKGSRK